MPESVAGFLPEKTFHSLLPITSAVMRPQDQHPMTSASRSFQVVVLFVGKVDDNVAGAALDQHVEDIAVLRYLRTSGTPTELDHRLVTVAKG